MSSTFWKSLGRSQIAAFLATLLDFSLLFLLTEVFGLWYVLSAALGAAGGAILNFSMNRNWSFEVDHLAWGPQAARYAVVSFGSLVLNVFGVWALTEGVHSPYGVSKVLTSGAVALLFNFPLHRHYVFK